MTDERLRVWTKLFGATLEQIADHWDGCLRCVHDVQGRPSRAEYERGARALSVCQTKWAYGDLPPSTRCVSKKEFEDAGSPGRTTS